MSVLRATNISGSRRQREIDRVYFWETMIHGHVCTGDVCHLWSMSNLELTLKRDRPRTRVDSILKAPFFVMIRSIHAHLGKLLIKWLVSLKMYPTSWLSIDSACFKSSISLSAPPCWGELVVWSFLNGFHSQGTHLSRGRDAPVILCSFAYFHTFKSQLWPVEQRMLLVQRFMSASTKFDVVSVSADFQRSILAYFARKTIR